MDINPTATPTANVLHIVKVVEEVERVAELPDMLGAQKWMLKVS
jgi:hypothetical protein